MPVHTEEVEEINEARAALTCCQRTDDVTVYRGEGGYACLLLRHRGDGEPISQLVLAYAEARDLAAVILECVSDEKLS